MTPFWLGLIIGIVIGILLSVIFFFVMLGYAFRQDLPEEMRDVDE